jgi:M3 family oligoendopeptidase
LEFKKQHNFKFDNITIPNPTFDKIAKDYEELMAALDRTYDTDSRIAVVQRWDQICRQFCTWCVFVEIKFKQDTANEKFQANLSYRDEMQPKVTELEIAIKRRFLKEPFRKDIESKFNKQIIALWESDILTYEPVIQDDLIAESKLKAQYTSLKAAAELQFKGKVYSLSEIGKFAQDADRKVRHTSLKAVWNWFAENNEQLDTIFDDLVMRRTGMARKLGYENYIDLAYKKWKRVGYDQTSIESFRKEVLKHIVPLASTLTERRRVRLGLEKLYAYDGGLFSLEGNPKPQGDLDFIVARATIMFEDLAPEMGEFFRMMKTDHLMDLETRQNKSTPECFYLPDFGLPFVLSNSKGTMGDIGVFIHEMGHAFQLYCSHHQPLLEYQTPTWDSAEIHSTSLEFLTYPFMEKFFDDKGAKQYRQTHLENSLLFLPFCVAIDHFQHLVYANPRATPVDRHAMWKEMESLYLPDWDWDDLTYPAKGGRWQLTPHIYTAPLFYIDYALSSICALQFWLMSKEDFSKSINDYIALCKRGGEASFPDLVSSAGLNDPFEEGCLTKVVEQSCKFLD